MRILFLVAVCITNLVSSVFAQTLTNENQVGTAPLSVEAGEQEPVSNRLANWRGILLSAEQAMVRAGLEDEELALKSEEISSIRLEALELDLKLAPVVAQIRAQLDELGPVPASDGPVESTEILQKRQQLEARYSRVDGEAKAARLISLRAGQIEQQIITNRRNRFVEQISRHSTSLFDFGLWQRFWQGLDGVGGRFYLLLSESLSALQKEITKAPLSLAMLLAGMATIFFINGFLSKLLRRRQKRILRRCSASKDLSSDDCNCDVRLASIEIVRVGLLRAAVLISLYFLIINVLPITARLDILLFEVIFIISILLITISLCRAFLDRGRCSRRLTLLPDEAAQNISNIIVATLFLIAIFRLSNKISILLVSPFEVSITLSGIMAGVCFATLFVVLYRIGAQTITTEQIVGIRRNLVRWGYLNPLFWLAAIVGILSLASGYLAFAEFLAWQILIAAMIFAGLWLCIELLDIHRERYLDVESGRWRQLSQATGFTRQAVLQGSVFGFGLAKLATILGAVAVIMISWGYRSGDWAGPVSEAFFGFKVGGLTVSFSSIALAITLFIAGYFVTRAIQHWMRFQFLPTTTLDPGLRNSIVTIFGYGGIVLAALLAITAAGLDLSKVAIVAGALSVGIGFGLQSIVNNFVSGLILLAERPIKSGDWIVTSGGEGTVRKTSVRSTEIETFDGATIIIPNSTLITDAVTNWTHHTQQGRIKIHIGVGYDSDPEQVRDILLACGRAHKRVVNSPAPVVFFQDFGADALQFELRAYLSDINNSASTKSDLRFAILAALREAKIEIPYPQRDIHIKTQNGIAVAKPTKRRRTKSQAK